MTHDAFLQEVVRTPDDDAPRLVYADWLDDHGDLGRATFIRLQCEMERDPERWDDLEPRVTALLHANGDAWRRQLPQVEGVVWGEFGRGFVEEMAVEAGRFGHFLDNADTLFAAAPVRSLTLAGLSDDDVARLVGLPQLAALTTLELTPPDPRANLQLFYPVSVGDAGAVALASCPHLANLRVLRLPFNHLGDEGARALLASPHLGRLRGLHLYGNLISDEVLEQLRERFGGLWFL